jgi:hypothetical protein
MPDERPRQASCLLCGLVGAALTGLVDRLLGLAETVVRRLTAPATRRDAPAAEEQPDAAHKFDLGAAVPEPMPEHIPWGYGQDRVTAMVVDPDRLYVYWEVTDEAIARARAGLGADGSQAALALRVYDVTGRLFDGTNAHDFFDQRIERGDRQWFFHIGRPTATVCVEVGLRAPDGRFVRIARSGRADFPRRTPAPDGPPQWLTVHAATGEIAAAVPEPPVPAAVPEEVAHRPGAAAEPWEPRVVGELAAPGVPWETPVLRTTWEAGPFPFPVAAPTLTVERFEEPARVEALDGRRRVVHAIWRIVIRGIGGWAAGRVLAVWEVRRSWVRGGGWTAPTAPTAAAAAGASELRWRAASEQRLGGASEAYLVGASELRLGGASERLMGGASEQRFRGAGTRPA